METSEGLTQAQRDEDQELQETIAYCGQFWDDAPRRVLELRNAGETWSDIKDRAEHPEDWPDAGPAGTGPPPTQWAPLRRFTENRLDPFPVDALPGPVALYVEALATELQVDPAMPGLLSVCCLAAACQPWAILRVREGWKEQLSLYGVAVAPPGERKSPCLSALEWPLLHYEGERMRREAGEVKANQSARKILEGQLSKAEQAAASGKAGTEQAMSLARELADFEDIYPFRMVLDDATPEKLTDEMARQRGCMAVVSSEAGTFDTMMGRYSDKVNLDIYLKSYTGDPVRVDRVGRAGCQIDNPRLSLILTAQPDALADVVQNKQARGRGLPARFLYVVCQSKLGFREPSPPPAPA
ncbi:MAG: DUF3987 domain-containing protein, partial [Clostridiales bacterium]|nr:DUF3987 domain-containing protein [Clostridiales bacterium]